jgi:hypothetical protein
MLRPADNYFEQQKEPVKSCLLALRQLILSYNINITEEWKYGMPFYCYKGKMCCYLWVHKKFSKPYLGIVAGSKIHDPGLLQEKRARMKILLVDAEKDLPVKQIKGILRQVVVFYDYAPGQKD